ncbi:hypothetical protein TrispH2_001469 [Trichoplax sp. H2]|nr:hypothetical protein TrispH2_001469 [Trichoplax sp. H2]|eukprot:RDD46236.1 hypothetical protein TrispH2_001469 [Trichoplax sp. H2]
MTLPSLIDTQRNYHGLNSRPTGKIYDGIKKNHKRQQRYEEISVNEISQSTTTKLPPLQDRVLKESEKTLSLPDINFKVKNETFHISTAAYVWLMRKGTQTYDRASSNNKGRHLSS